MQNRFFSKRPMLLCSYGAYFKLLSFKQKKDSTRTTKLKLKKLCWMLHFKLINCWNYSHHQA